MKKLTQRQVKLVARVFAGKNLEQMVGAMDCREETISEEDMEAISGEIVNIGNRLMGQHWTNQSTIDAICAQLFPNRILATTARP